MLRVLSLALVAFVFTACSSPDDADAPDASASSETVPASEPTAAANLSEDAPVMALLFAADWCASCERMDPALTAARETTADLPIEFVVLDHTDDATSAEAVATAEDLGVGELYAAQAGGTGFVLLVSRETGEVIDRIGADDTQTEMEAKLAGAISA